MTTARTTQRGQQAVAEPSGHQDAQSGEGVLSQGVAGDSEAREWHLWLRGLLGPTRRRSRTVAGIKIVERGRLPELPLSPNDRVHPMMRSKIVKAWRGATRDAAKDHAIPPCERIRISAVLFRRALGTADEDNDRARLKPLLDGLRDAGVIANDTRGYVEHGPVTEKRARSLGVGVLLIVEAIDLERRP